MKILIAFGTRPEAIKMAPVILELKKRKSIKTVICVTGQHKEMLQQVLSTFQIVPDFDLSIMKEGQTLFDITNAVLLQIKPVLEKEKPDLVLVHGDTSTTFSVALACYYLKIPVGHVEAGLRTYDIYSPFPEEFNRQAVSLISKYNFAPTELAKENLIQEKKDPSGIFVTGNTAIDALKYTVRPDFDSDDLIWAKNSRLLLLTAHRRENIGEPMHHIFKAIRRIVETFDDVKVIYPIHKNPIVRSIAEAEFAGNERIRLIEPLDVVEFHNYMAHSYFILTDSGGVQEEAPSLGKPVLVLREVTERPEGISAGTLRIVGTSEAGVFKAAKELLENRNEYEKMSKAKNPYGDGFAAVRIANILCGDLK
jgi:UDP-N-acetylglucosamine 2-epimerase